MGAASDQEGKFTFLRQGAWILSTTLFSGILMFAVHVFGFWMPAAEYGLFATLLNFLSLMRIPSLGLKRVFAQQTAAAITPFQHRELVGAIHTLLQWTLLIWLGIVALLALFQGSVLELFKIDNPIALWITMVLGLLQLWMPILGGVLQGHQNFLWLGWIYILNGVGRFLAVAVIVVLFGGESTGAITGVLIGVALALSVTVWQTTEDWQGHGERFAWLPWLKTVTPLTLGLGVPVVMLSVDMVWVRTAFEESQGGMYARARLFGQGLVMFTIPLASVMFPKIVRSIALAKNTNVLIQALGSTALLGGLAAMACTTAGLLTPWAFGLLTAEGSPLGAGFQEFLVSQKSQIFLISRLAPWCVWCMFPLPLANVLINNLMARQHFRCVPWIVAIAVAYPLALRLFGTSLVAVFQTLGGFNLILFIVLAGFTFKQSRHRHPVATLANYGSRIIDALRMRR